MAAPIGDSRRYMELGVSATKTDVYGAIQALPTGISANTFCKVLPDIFGGDDKYVTVAHSDGAGSKSILAYLHYRLTGDTGAFRHIAQDAIVMNLDDMLCVGVTSGFLLTSIVNRNARRIDGDVLRAIIGAKQHFCEHMCSLGVDIRFVGGETADVGDVVQTLLVDANMASRFPRSDVLINRIRPGMAIVGLESAGAPSVYESSWNSGIGCNGVTLARHELFRNDILQTYPEICDSGRLADGSYQGPYMPFAPLPGADCTVLDAMLSPTRTFAPIMRRVFAECRTAIGAVIHNTGGAHTKCVRFANACSIEKDLGADIPAIFKAIQNASNLPWSEMAKVFNLGVRMEIYCDHKATTEIIAIARECGVCAREIGETCDLSPSGGVALQVSVNNESFMLTSQAES